MNWKEIIPRIDGFSTPIFGVSWTPPDPDRAIARQVIAKMENRRVLFSLTEYEYPKPCWQSVNEIRADLSAALGLIEGSSELGKQLRGIRTACLEFAGQCEQKQLIVDRLSDYPYPAKHWEFIETLKRMRDQVGWRIAGIAVAYGIDVDEPLASALPPASDGDA